MKTRSPHIALCGFAIATGLWLARPTVSMPAGETLQQQIVSQERKELESLKTGDMNLFASLLAEDAVFLDDHGAATKAEVVQHTAGFRLTEYSMEDVRFVQVSANSGLITYKITEKGNSNGREFSAQVYISALWAERAGKWVCLFSQETTAAK
jgi:hypothetical protein